MIIKELECPECDRTFKTKTTLNCHLQKVHLYNKEEAKEYTTSLNIMTESEKLK